MFSAGFLRRLPMAEAKTVTTRTITLTLSEPEAETLLDFLRNPPFGYSEEISQTKIRENLFSALRDALEDR